MTQTSLHHILLTPPDTLDQARTLGLPLAHMAFQLGDDGHLHQSPLPPGLRGGWMLVGCARPPEPPADPWTMVREIVELCLRRQFGGVILDLECPPDPLLSRMISLLDTALSRRGRPLILPEAYGAYSPRASLYLSSALSGGSLRRRLEQAVETYGAKRLILSLHRSREDFFLPSPAGSGRPLSQEEWQRTMERLDPVVFFSPELCAYYFTYMSRTSGAHFVLFDNSASLRRKQELAKELGILTTFWLFPQTEDLLPEVLV